VTLSRIAGFVFGSGVVLLGVALLFLAAGSLAGLPGPIPAGAAASIAHAGALPENRVAAAAAHIPRAAFARPVTLAQTITTATARSRHPAIAHRASAHLAQASVRASSRNGPPLQITRIAQVQSTIAEASGAARNAPIRAGANAASRRTPRPSQHRSVSSNRANAQAAKPATVNASKAASQRTVVAYAPRRNVKAAFVPTRRGSFAPQISHRRHKRTANAIAPRADGTPEPPIGYDANPALLHADVPDGTTAATPAPAPTSSGT
jgi:hypothetical protein